METAPSPLAFQFFDHDAGRTVVERRLPHWSQAGTVSFITWRTVDSMPSEVLERWLDGRSRWLKEHGINPEDPAWNQQLHRLDPTTAQLLTHLLEPLAR